MIADKAEVVVHSSGRCVRVHGDNHGSLSLITRIPSFIYHHHHHGARRF